MKVLGVVIFFFGLVAMSCSNQPGDRHSDKPKTDKQVKAEMVHDIDSMRKIHQSKGSKDLYTVNKLITAYTQYRNKFKDDPITPEYLRSAGDLAMSIGEWNMAADLNKNFFNSFQSHSYRDDALFMLGYIYDFELRDKSLAKQTYEHYFKLYGDSVHIDQVRARLTDLDLTEEELLEKFRKQNNLE